jgi:hypothetical protein
MQISNGTTKRSIPHTSGSRFLEKGVPLSSLRAMRPGGHTGEPAWCTALEIDIFNTSLQIQVDVQY